jgi:phosphate transport system permease protein
VTRTNEGQFRRQRVAIDLGEEVALSSGAPITLIDISFRPAGPVVCAMTDDGLLMIKAITSRRNLMTGRVTTTFVGGELRLDDVQQRGAPMRLLLSGTADNAFIAWEDGHLLRVDLRDLNAPRVAERIELVGAPGATLTALDFLIGKTSLVSGDSLGAVRVWFRIKPEDAPTSDGAVLVNSRSFLAGSSPVISLAASMRTRLLAAGYADGDASLFHVTAGRELAHISTPGGAPARALAIAPRDNAFASVSGAGLHRWSIDGRHPSITLRSIFTPVWYEGYSGPQHVWQSSSGTDDFEPKLGLAPLIFGTIKATLYSMIFGAPLAILAAVYTSEFLAPAGAQQACENGDRIHGESAERGARVPGGARDCAVYPEHRTGRRSSAFFTIPGIVFLARRVHRGRSSRRTDASPRRTSALPAARPDGGAADRSRRSAAGWGRLCGGGAVCSATSRGWLDGKQGSAFGGWFLVLLPLSARLRLPIVMTQNLGPCDQDTRLRARPGRVVALSSLARASTALVFVGGRALAVLIAWALSHAVAGLGARGEGLYLGTYVQRNAMVVGFVMGFAIIPIIYTIAEDALSAVPEHLAPRRWAPGRHRGRRRCGSSCRRR